MHDSVNVWVCALHFRLQPAILAAAARAMQTIEMHRKSAKKAIKRTHQNVPNNSNMQKNRNQQYQIKVLKMSTTPYRQTNVCFCTRNTPETKKRKREKQENFGPQCLQGNGGLSHLNITIGQ